MKRIERNWDREVEKMNRHTANENTLRMDEAYNHVDHFVLLLLLFLLLLRVDNRNHVFISVNKHKCDYICYIFCWPVFFTLLVNWNVFDVFIINETGANKLKEMNQHKRKLVLKASLKVLQHRVQVHKNKINLKCVQQILNFKFYKCMRTNVSNAKIIFILMIDFISTHL